MGVAYLPGIQPQATSRYFMTHSLPPALDYLHYQFRPDLQVLVARWLRQPTEEELHAGYYRLLDVAAETAARLWLIDARRRTNASQQATPWMIEEFMPQLPARLGGQVRLAYLFMPAHLHEIEHDATVPPLTYFNGRPYHVERFIEEHAAMAWLQAMRAQEEANRAE